MGVITLHCIVTLVACSAIAYGVEETWEWSPLGSNDEVYLSLNRADSWFKARQLCLVHGGDLMTYENATDSDVVNTLIGTSSHLYWIGANKYNSQEWRWSSGSKELEYTDWDHGDWPADDKYPAYCAYADRIFKGRWRNLHCNTAGFFICRRLAGHTAALPDIQPPPTQGYCPSGYIGLDNDDRCFKVIIAKDESTGVTWDEAREKCHEGPGRFQELATIESRLQNALVTSELREPSIGLWTGLYEPSDTRSRTWYWLDNTEPQFINWGYDRPGYRGSCVVMRYSPAPPGSWEEANCNAKRGYICQTYKDPDNINSIAPIPEPNKCTHDYEPFAEGCYQLVESPASDWQVAAKRCQDKGAHLVSIFSEAENAALLVMTSSLKTDVWIGMREDLEGNEYFWLDGSYPVYTKIGENGPELSPAQDDSCFALNKDGHWYHTLCTHSLPYICKINHGPGHPTPAPIAGSCPVNDDDKWFDIGSYCYFISTNKAFWMDALADCNRRHQGASLASIHDAVTNDVIYKQMANTGAGTFFNLWIGLHRIIQDKEEYMWSDGESLRYDNWAPGQPENADDHDCVFMHTSDLSHAQMWATSKCNNLQYYVCKVQKGAAVTSPPEVAGTCPEKTSRGAWQSYGDRCLFFLPNDLVVWDDGLSICHEVGGERASLARLQGPDDNAYVSEAMLERSDLPDDKVLKYYWIGLSRKDNGSPFLWADTQEAPKETFWWREDEPTHADSYAKHCVQVDKNTGLWYTEFCFTPLGMACSVDKVLDSNADGSASNGRSSGEVAGVVLGSLLGVALLVAMMVLVFLKRDIILEKTGLMKHYQTQTNEPQNQPI